MANIDIIPSNHATGFGNSSSGNRGKPPYYPDIISRHKGSISYIFWFLI
jgi:hypothetical protein